jgi:tryptophan synthase beta chain
MHAHLWETGRAQFYSITDEEAMQGVVLCSRLEGIIPAIESAHAIWALTKMDLLPTDVVVLNLSGRGDKDLTTIINYLDNIEKPHGEQTN